MAVEIVLPRLAKIIGRLFEDGPHLVRVHRPSIPFNNQSGHAYHVRVSPEGAVESVASAPATLPAPSAAGPERPVPAPLAGTVVQVKVKPGDSVSRGDVVLVLEAMKMETEVRSPEAGRVLSVPVKAGDGVQVGETLLTLG